MIITIDGPSAAGKGTLSRGLSDHYGYAYMETGMIFRRIAYTMIQSHLAVTDIDAILSIARDLHYDSMENHLLHRSDIASLASEIGVIPALRDITTAIQRDFADHHRHQGVILDGRDIGTVICPHADKKIFITASPDVRARRRYQEMIARGLDAPSVEDIRAALLVRDERDSKRALGPLVPAPDALILDTTSMDKTDVLKKAIDFIENRFR